VVRGNNLKPGVYVKNGKKIVVKWKVNRE
jgi:hypothetical protein